MAMSVGSGKTPSANINVTPMIDLLLVLLIIFMIIVPLAPAGERAQIPQPSTEKAPTPEIIDHTVVLQLIAADDDQLVIKINDDRVARPDLKERLETIFRPRKERVLFVKADPRLKWDEVAQVIDTTHTAGIPNVGLLTTGRQ